MTRKGLSKSTREWIALIMTATIALSILMLVGVGAYAVVANTVDWTTTHIKGPNLTNPLAALIGSLLSAVIAGVVGYLGGVGAGRWEAKTYSPPSDPVSQVGSAVNEVLDKITKRQ